MGYDHHSKDDLFLDLKKLLGEEILVITRTAQLDLLGQIFRPVFSGTLSQVDRGYITLSPAIIKMVNAPFYEFPLPLSIPIERIAAYSADIPSDKVFPLT